MARPSRPPDRGRWVLWAAPAGLILVVAVLASLGGASVRNAAGTQVGVRASAGVNLAGRPVGGRGPVELEHYLAGLSRSLPVNPLDAKRDPRLGLLPSLDGVQLNLDATVAAVLRASPGADVPIRCQRLPAAITVWDLPPEPIRQGNPAKAQVALAINVAWGNEFLPDILAALRAHRVRATFFLVGSWAEKFPEDARRIADAGHEIASHGYTTVDYQGLSEDQLRRQVLDAGEAILKATGQRPTLFSPHKGEWTPALLQLLRQEEYLPIHWTVDTVDWKDPPPGEMNARVLSRVGPGSIILLHPTRASAAGLDGLLAGLERKGLKAVDVSTLLDPDPLAGGLPPIQSPPVSAIQSTR